MKVYHKKDPLKRVGKLIARFKWLGQEKSMVKMPDGTYQKDYSFNFVPIEKETLTTKGEGTCEST